MCHFITMVVPAGADLGIVEEVLKERQRYFGVIENSSLAGLLRPGETYVSAMAGGCDCGTALGSADIEPADYSGDIRRLKRKRWSKAKIARWLEQKRQGEGRFPLRRESCPDPDGWVTLLHELKARAALPYAGLLLHWYSGDLTEPIKATREILPDDEALGTALYRMKEDVIYEIR